MKLRLFAVALMMSVACLPARADDVSNRMDMLEQQLRQLVGQVEELNYTVKQLQTQLASQPKQMGAAEPAPAAPVAPALTLKKKLVMQQPLPTQPQTPGAVSDGGVETIDETPLQPGVAQVAGAAPPPQILGAQSNKAAKTGDGGFQGQVLVAPGGVEQIGGADAGNTDTGVQPVSMQPETPDDLFLRSEKSLLQLQYVEAESGFKDFLSKYPDHNLAGSAQFKLGETYFAQQRYREAAQNYLAGYKQFPKSRRAPDSLMKLGLALNKMGENQQGCAALNSVGDEYPNAVEVKKRAQAEAKRAGC